MVQVEDFQLDTEDLTTWLDDMEARLCEMDELAIEPHDLIEQSNILSVNAVSIVLS